MAYQGRDLSTGRSEIYYYTSTSGGETSISASTDGVPISYTVGWVAVYLNGVRLHDSDFTATTGSSITGLSALTKDDVVIIEAMHTFSSSDAVPATGGTFSGAITAPSIQLSSNIIKASDGGTAITLDTSDNVTLAGTANNVGTVTAGTLGSNVVFPSGHVVKTTLLSDTTGGSGGGSGDTAWDIANVYTNSSPTGNAWLDTTNYFKYTPLSSSNKLIIHYNFGLRFNASGAHGYSYRWGITPSGGSEAFPNSAMAQVPSSNAHGFYDGATPDDVVHALTTTFYYDFGSAVNHEFKFYVAGYQWSYVQQGGVYSNNCQVLLQEIQG